MTVTLIGLGCGTLQSATAEGLAALEKSDAIFGAPRLLELLSAFPKPKIPFVRSADLAGKLASGSYERPAVVFSGDTGFHSGARMCKLLLKEQGISLRLLPGISSVQYLAARLGRPWQDWGLYSAHAGDCDAVTAVMQGKPAFFLTGGERTPAWLCERLRLAGLGALPVTVAERLSCDDERITACTAAEAAEMTFDPLSVLLAEPAVVHARCPGIPDDHFVRGTVPMTKRFVRAAILSVLCVRPEETVWDVGAGTGAVSVELALSASRGRCYAVEERSEACALIRENRQRFGAWNLTLTEGHAPEALERLPAPDAVFVGGSGGALEAILDRALEKNPHARICVSAVTLETLGAAAACFSARGLGYSATEIAVSRSQSIGARHLMRAENPVYLISAPQEAAL